MRKLSTKTCRQIIFRQCICRQNIRRRNFVGKMFVDKMFVDKVFCRRMIFNSNQLSQHLQRKLKDAELKFITVGSHSFNVLENDGALDFVQTAIDIGAHMGNVLDVFYGRKTIRTKAMAKFKNFSTTIRQVINELIKNHCVAVTCDMWMMITLSVFTLISWSSGQMINSNFFIVY